MTAQGDLGRGPEVAASNFRNFSFISGVLFKTELAHRHATDKWDGSEQYQMYLGSRIISDGGTLVGVTQNIIHEDIQIPDESVDSVTRRARLSPCPIVERPLPLNQHGRLVADAILPYAPPRDRNRIIRKIIFQLYAFPYAHNVLAYRSIQSWKYAVGIAIGMRPANTLRGIQMGRGTYIQLQLVFAAVTLGALLVPIPVFRFLQPTLYSIAKRAFARAGV
jgi:hypothetical protein